MEKVLKEKSFLRDILPIILFVAVVIATIVMVFLHSDETGSLIGGETDITPTPTATSTPTPTDTPKPTATPRVVYIPDPEELKDIPKIDSLDLIKSNITAEEKLNLSWANITEWEILNFSGVKVVLLCYKDLGEEGAEDDKLLASYMLEIIDEKEEEAVLIDVTPEERYRILVDKEDFSFAILTLDENMEYTQVIATFPCALGRSTRMTPTGTFEISSKGDWKTWKTGEYSPYYTRYTSGLYIHGSLYSNKTFDSMIEEYYERIGTNHTSGCLRTTIEGSRWVYYNCPAGTVVEIVASSDLVDHVEKPEIDPNYPTWDPTDPNKPST